MMLGRAYTTGRQLDVLLDGFGRNGPTDGSRSTATQKAPEGSRGLPLWLVLSTCGGFLIAAVTACTPFIFAPLVVGACRKTLHDRRNRTRALAFEGDFTAFLQSLGASVRTGMDPLSALLHAELLFPPSSVLREELHLLRQALDAGASEEEALRSFGRSILHPDLPAFRTAFLLSRTQGASLGSCLQRLARVTRQRQSFRRKVRAAVAMQKLSGIGIAICTLSLFVMQAVTNREALAAAWRHPIGSKVLCVSMILVGAGLCWLFALTRRRS
jgi:Flp pilus assembly protein TadB